MTRSAEFCKLLLLLVTTQWRSETPKITAIVFIIFFSTFLSFGKSFVPDSTSDTWTWISPSTSGNNLNDIYFRDAKNGWAAGDYGTFLLTQDGGVTWQSRTDKTFANLTAILEHNGVLWRGFNGGLSCSIDNGNSWANKFISNKKAIRSIMFCNDSTGIACGDSGLIIRTSDAGDRWFASDSALTLAIYQYD